MIRHVLFDLDGTLTDSADGITRCIARAVAAVGGSEPEAAPLRRFIGTPLADIFHELLDTTDEDLVEQAIVHYRERFDRVGYSENRLYAHIDELLAELSQRGHRLYVATAKRQPDADRVVDHFGLTDRFTGVFGVVDPPERSDKGLIVRRILTTHGFAARDAALVGDRSNDVHGAHRAGVRAIGAAWGYGTPEELREAKPHQIAATPWNILDCLET